MFGLYPSAYSASKDDVCGDEPPATSQLPIIGGQGCQSLSVLGNTARRRTSPKSCPLDFLPTRNTTQQNQSRSTPCYVQFSAYPTADTTGFDGYNNCPQFFLSPPQQSYPQSPEPVLEVHACEDDAVECVTSSELAWLHTLEAPQKHSKKSESGHCASFVTLGCLACGNGETSEARIASPQTTAISSELKPPPDTAVPLQRSYPSSRPTAKHQGATTSGQASALRSSLIGSNRGSVRTPPGMNEGAAKRRRTKNTRHTQRA